MKHIKLFEEFLNRQDDSLINGENLSDDSKEYADNSFKSLTQQVNEAFSPTHILESWPFSDKKHIDLATSKKLLSYASKNYILNDVNSREPGTVLNKQFQTNNVEHAWELFEIWVSIDAAKRPYDVLTFMSEFTFTSQDDIWDKTKRRRVLNDFTDIAVGMMQNRSPKDVDILKKMKILI